MKSSPFDKVIIELGSPIDKSFTYTDILLLEHLQSLRASYVFLRNIDYDFSGLYKKEIVTQEDRLLTMQLSQSQIKLAYFLFINCLCQFDRSLTNKKKPQYTKEHIPLYKRIRFFRNKALEHWDDYIDSPVSSGFTWVNGKAPIPVFQTSHLHADLINFSSELSDIFHSFGISYQNSFSGASMVGNNADYSESLYKALEQLPEWNTFPSDKKDEKHLLYKRLTELLFHVGFPCSIVDVESYCNDLLDYVRCIKWHHQDSSVYSSV